MSKFLIPSHWVMKNINILVVGAGGTGSIVLSMLAQMDYNLSKLSDGITRLNVLVADGDDVSSSNIGRQAFYSSDIGMNKAEVLTTRFNQFMNTNWSWSTDFVAPEDIEEHEFDVIISCVDSAKFRYELGNHFKDTDNSSLWIDCGNSVSTGQILLGHLGGYPDEDKLPNIFDLYGSALESMEDRPEDSCGHESALSAQDFGINHAIAMQATNLLWQLIRHGSIDVHGAFVDLKSSTVNPINIDPNVWASFGYGQPVRH